MEKEERKKVIKKQKRLMEKRERKNNLVKVSNKNIKRKNKTESDREWPQIFRGRI